MSAVAAQPRLALRRIAVRAAVAPLTLLVTASVAVRVVAAWLRATPSYVPDEYMYAEFSRSLAAGHLPAVRGGTVSFLPLLQPLLTAPAWLLPTVEEGYRAVQIINAVLVSLAAIPVYLLARRVGLGARLALAAAAVSLTIPSLLFASYVMSEPVAYPVALAAIAAAVHALDRPSGRSYALFLALTALAMFTRMQFVVLVPCFALALAVVAVRERRIREFVRSHRIPLVLFALAAVGLYMVGPGRNSGYYPSFRFIPGFHLSTATRVFGADALVLAFAAGFATVPGTLLGSVLGLVRPRGRDELAFSALTISLTLGLLVEAVVYGHLDYVQERYLFYVLPLWTIAFLLYAQRGWPHRRAHALVGLVLVLVALVFPLQRYTIADQHAHSPLLIALKRLGELLHDDAGASLAFVLCAAAITLAVIGASFLVPRRATAVTIALALVATVAASVGASSYDIRYSRYVKNVVLGGHPTWVDDAHAGPATMVLLPGSRAADVVLFWNRSIEKLVIFPATTAPDSFALQHAQIGADGTIRADGRTIGGPIVLGNYTASVSLRDATTLKRAPEHVLVRPARALQMSLMGFGRYSDGWLADGGYFLLWPATPTGSISGRLVLPLRPPRGGGTVGLRFANHGKTEFVRTAAPGHVTDVTVPVCSKGPIAVGYSAGPSGSIGDGRHVAARAGRPRFVPVRTGC